MVGSGNGSCGTWRASSVCDQEGPHRDSSSTVSTLTHPPYAPPDLATISQAEVDEIARRNAELSAMVCDARGLPHGSVVLQSREVTMGALAGGGGPGGGGGSSQGAPQSLSPLAHAPSKSGERREGGQGWSGPPDRGGSHGAMGGQTQSEGATASGWEMRRLDRGGVDIGRRGGGGGGGRGGAERGDGALQDSGGMARSLSDCSDRSSWLSAPPAKRIPQVTVR